MMIILFNSVFMAVLWIMITPADELTYPSYNTHYSYTESNTKTGAVF